MNTRSDSVGRTMDVARLHGQLLVMLVVLLMTTRTAVAQGEGPPRPSLVQIEAGGQPPAAGLEVGEEVPTDQGEDFRGLHLPSDRTASRGLAMAAEAIRNGQFSQAIRYLDRLLGNEEDSFADSQVGASHFAGLKAEARRLLGSLPKVAREDYVATYGTTAKNRLEAASAAGDLAEIERIARQFFHTPAGYEASLMLAQYERDMGRPLAAAALLQELVDTEQAAALFGPQLFLVTAIAWRDAGQLNQANAVLVQLKARFADAQIEISGQNRPLFTSQQDPLDWLELVAGEAIVASQDLHDHWTMYRGNAARNGVADGGVPHMRARWRARVTNSPQLENLLTTLRRGYERRGVVTLPATQPISVGDVVLMRTAENLVGVDFKTGNLIWDVRAEPDEHFKQLLAAAENSDAAENSPQLAHALEQRMWDDAVFGTISSDGERVYVVRGLSLSIVADANRRPMGAFAGGGVRIVRGRIVQNGGASDGESPTNTLTAVSLRTEGKRVWEINGGDVGGKLDGAFFLGPPLCVDGRLYVLAEIKSAINLVVLRNIEAHPYWELEWMQQLASLEIGVDLDPLRRLAGAMPSMQGGILICPTSAGVVVAVDLTKRSLLWAYRYPLREQDVAQVPGMGFGVPGFIEAPGARTNERWLDATAVLADGKVLVTPRESGELHCLDLASGDLVWKRKRGDGLFIAGVHGGVVAIVGTDRLEAVRLDNGQRAWESDHTLLPDGTQPSGRGFLSDGKYYLPLTSAEVIAVDLYNGEIASRVRSRDGQVLGNLIAHRGGIVAQSELLLEKYDQRDAFRERTEALLQGDPSDPTALRNLGELALAEGNLVEAVTLLKGSLASDSSSRQTREMLTQALLDALEDDFSRFRDELPLVRQLATLPEHRTRLARVTATGLQAIGNVLAAFENYVQLAAIDRETPQVQAISAAWESRTSRWIAAQLGDLWQRATAEERLRMQAMLREQNFLPERDAPVEEFLAFFEYFGSLPAWDSQRLLAATGLVDAGAGLDAELALAGISQMDESADELHALRKQFQAAIPGLRPQPPWPSGRILVQRQAIAAGEQHDRFQSWRVDGPVGDSLRGYRFFFDQIQQSLVMVNPYGNVELNVPLLGSSEANAESFARGRCHAALSGHLLVVSSGEKIMAIDLLGPSQAASGNVLWEATTIEPFAGLAAQISYPQFVQQSRGFGEYGKAKWGHAQDEAGRPLGWIGPVGPAGVVFQAQGELRSVDPLTGELNWLRRDVPPGCVLFGDDELVFALPHQQTETIVFRAADGKRLGTRSVPPLDEYFEIQGRRILRWSTSRPQGGQPQAVLELVDAWKGDAVWTKTFDIDAQVCSVEGEWVGVMDRAGRFELIDIASGDVVLAQDLLADPTLGRIFVLLSRDRVVLVTDRFGAPARRRAARDGFNISSIYEPDYPIVTGRVYIFDRASGKSLLPVPAEIEQQGLALHQPVELPVLGFVCHTREGGGQGNRTNISLLLLNKRTGSSIVPATPLSELFFPDATTTRFRLYREPDDANVLMVDMANHRVRLEFTDEAAAPEPPADSDVEGSRKKPSGGGVFRLFGIGDASAPRQRR